MRRAVVAVVLLLGGGLGACAVFGGDAPDRTCRNDRDCFRAQGERCETDAGECIVIDAAAAASVSPGDPATAPPSSEVSP